MGVCSIKMWSLTHYLDWRLWDWYGCIRNLHVKEFLRKRWGELWGFGAGGDAWDLCLGRVMADLFHTRLWGLWVFTGLEILKPSD